MTLIEILLTLAILTISLSVVTQWLKGQQEGAAKHTDRLASLDLERALASALSDPQVCANMLSGGAPVIIDPMSLASTVIPPFPTIPSRALAGAPPALVGDGATPASAMSPRLVASAIRLINLACAVPPCTPATTQYNAEIEVSFDPARTKEQPLRFPVILRTLPSPGGQILTDCRLGGSQGPSGTIVRTVVESGATTCGDCPGNPSLPVIANCPANTEVSGCGYFLTSDGGIAPPIGFFTRAPSSMQAVGNGCEVLAGQALCGACFQAQATCLRIQ